jgi:hypothetical protein
MFSPVLKGNLSQLISRGFMGKIITTDLIQQYIADKPFTLLSKRYKNSQVNLKWKCDLGHIWYAKWNNINSGNTQCPYCWGKNFKTSIDILQQHAISKGGLLISTEYKNNLTKVLWQCSKEHQWFARWRDINLLGQWCPECSRFKNENLCKTLLEQKLNILLSKYRFLYKGNRYEFDGYNEEHKIAFEYHGIQHYIYPNHWHKTEEQFKAAQQRDKDKEQYCKENNIQYIIIPYTANKKLEEAIHNLHLTPQRGN